MRKIIIFGASGDTGKYFVQYFVENYKEKGYQIVAVGTRDTNWFEQYKIEYYLSLIHI